jgi:transcription elongation factor Elf1
MNVYGWTNLVPAEGPQQRRARIEAQKRQAHELRKQNLERAVRRVFLCPGCGALEDVHGRYAHQWKQRLWPCIHCGYGAGKEAPPLLYQNPASGIVYTEEQWTDFLDSPR